MENLSNQTLNQCITSYETGDYDLSLKIGSIFVLLIFSFIGVATPTLVKGRDWKIVDQILFVGKFFGAGVITATGFIHIFPSAVQVLSDPCLPEFFQNYSASAGLFALIAVLFTHLFEYLAQNISSSLGEGKATLDLDAFEIIPTAPQGHSHSFLWESSSNHRHRVAVYILEAGIAVHSIIIGVDLGLAVGHFRTLLIALVFHQFFEGIGFGYKLSELKEKKRLRPLINSFLYSCTTPIGVVIGILSHLNYSPTDYAHATAAKGITDAMAAGILIYVSLVSMLYEEFNSESFQKLPLMNKMINFIALYSGAGIMSLIGLWA